MTNTRARVCNAANRYATTHKGARPKYVHFTCRMEARILVEATTGHGEALLGVATAQRIREQGTRAALPSFLGYRIVWNAPRFKVT